LVDAREYLRRIGAEGVTSPTARTLRELHLAHLRSVPFENLDVSLGVPIVLDPERILEKIVLRGRGGFCYELNYAFSWLLGEIGFRTSLLSGEVSRADGGFGIPFDHMALRVEVEGAEWLADVGFGDSFLEPFPLEEGRLHEEPGFSYRVSRSEGYFRLERAPRGAIEYVVQYRFTTTPRSLQDFRGGCEYHQTSPQSTFKQKVLATRALEDGRVTVTPDRVVLRRGATRVEMPIDSERAFREALARHTGILLETP
jgi:N-hydroxyarylamine O-acetyltransferase